jgi:hypothetical protein
MADLGSTHTLVAVSVSNLLPLPLKCPISHQTEPSVCFTYDGQTLLDTAVTSLSFLSISLSHSLYETNSFLISFIIWTCFMAFNIC